MSLLPLQAVAIAAAIQRAAEAQKRNIGMVLPTQSILPSNNTTAILPNNTNILPTAAIQNAKSTTATEQSTANHDIKVTYTYTCPWIHLYYIGSLKI